jgi:hypothetical protein
MLIFGCGFVHTAVILYFINVLHLPVLPKMIAPAVGQNAEQPAVQHFRVAQLTVILQRLGQGFLYQVVCQRRVMTPGISNPI